MSDGEGWGSSGDELLPDVEAPLDATINGLVRAAAKEDKRAGRSAPPELFITPTAIRAALERCNYACVLCSTELEWGTDDDAGGASSASNSPALGRHDAALPHTLSNTYVVCDGCASQRGETEP